MNSLIRTVGVAVGVLLVVAAVAGSPIGQYQDRQESGQSKLRERTYVEATGTVDLDCQPERSGCRATLRLDSAEPGSQVWYFSHNAALGNDWQRLQVKLTSSFLGDVRYEKRPRASTLVIYGGSSGEVSYQLLAPVRGSVSEPKVSEQSSSETELFGNLSEPLGVIG